MYELLRMINSDPAQPTRNHILYPGTSCYPLSPMAVKPNDDETQNMISDNDQMKIILRKLGKQKDYDLSFIQTQDAYDYIEGINNEGEHTLNNYLTDILQINP